MVTWPARIKARARSRDGARPRSTRTTSSRVLVTATESTLPRHDPVGDSAQQAVGQPGVFERRVRPLQAVGRERAGAVEAEQRRVGRFRGGGVLARRLAERRRITFDIEDVIDDLEGEAD